MANENEHDLLSWLGLRRKPDYSKARWLGGLITLLLALLILALVIPTVIEFLQAIMGKGEFEDDTAQSEAIRNTGLVLAAIVGVPFIVWRTLVAQQQVQISEQGQITDRINKAVEGLGAERTQTRIGRVVRLLRPKQYSYLVPDGGNLSPTIQDEHGFEVTNEEFWIWEDDDHETIEGTKYTVTRWTQPDTVIEWQHEEPVKFTDSKVTEVGDWQGLNETKPNLEVRIGAIYALERISQDSARDHIQIMEILCAYIRQNTPVETASTLTPTNAEWAAHYSKIPGGSTPRADIQAAVSVIARRKPDRKAQEQSCGFLLDLRNCNLQNMKFSIPNEQADWNGAHFDGSNLDQADFGDSDCVNASFEDCSLGNPSLQSVELEQANFRHATFKYIQFHKKGLKLVNWNILEVADTMAAVFEFCVFSQLKIENQFHIATLRNCRFVRCRFEHAWFFQTIEGTEPKDCRFIGCAIRNCTFRSDISVSLDVSEFFGDGSVKLPEGKRPKHWPEQILDDDQFETQWRKWQADPDNYTPLEPPKPDA